MFSSPRSKAATLSLPMANMPCWIRARRSCWTARGIGPSWGGVTGGAWASSSWAGWAAGEADSRRALAASLVERVEVDGEAVSIYWRV